MHREQKQFKDELDSEIIKVAKYYSKLIGGIKQKLAEQIGQKENFGIGSDHELIFTANSLAKLCFELVDVCSYVDLNIVCIRKSLKKFDKRMKGLGMP